tara:strand:- start:4759 stop:5070 length:312 start_codon:yes stop_codon:yes gene_type:complete
MSEGKWADFVITAVKRGPGTGRISHLQIHKDLGSSISQPEIVDKMVIAHNIKKGKKYMTVFKISETDWKPGEYVRSFVKDGDAFLRSDDNKVALDNLGTLPDL